MTRRRQPKISEAQFRRFKETCLQAKAAEWQQAHGDPAPVVYRDALLRTLLVAEHGGRLYLVPRRPDGWTARQEITMTESARSERLTVAHDVTADWLGIK